MSATTTRGPAPVRVSMWLTEPGLSTRRVEDAHGLTWQRVGTGWGAVGSCTRPSQARPWHGLVSRNGPIFTAGTAHKLRAAAAREAR